MPCSKSACKEHVDQMIENKNCQDEFDCLVCKSKREMPICGIILDAIGKNSIDLNLHLSQKAHPIFLVAIAL